MGERVPDIRQSSRTGKEHGVLQLLIQDVQHTQHSFLALDEAIEATRVVSSMDNNCMMKRRTL